MFTSIPGQSYTYYNDPKVEVANLIKNGSASNPHIYNLTLDYSYITKIHWTLNFVDNSFSWDNFGSKTKLTNGIDIVYNGISLVGSENIKTNYGFMRYAYNSFYGQDTKNPKGNIIDTQWLLTSFIPTGLEITTSKTIQIHIHDTILTTYTNLLNFTATFKGYKSINSFFSYQAENNNIYYHGQSIIIKLEDLTINDSYIFSIQDQLQELDQQNSSFQADYITYDLSVKYNPLIPDAYNLSDIIMKLYDSSGVVLASQSYSFILQQDQMQALLSQIFGGSGYTFMIAVSVIMFALLLLRWIGTKK